MKAVNVHLGDTYEVKISGKFAPVRIDRAREQRGWYGTNLVTGRTIVFRSAARLRRNLTLLELAREYYADLVAGVAPAPGQRVVGKGDYDGLGPELEKMRVDAQLARDKR